MGIIHETTAPYTAQSNGRAERMNRTINESVRSMLYYANLPDSFWAEAATTAAYTWNRLPSNAINDQIPFELWFRRPLYQDDIKRLQTFGCIVYAHVPKQRRVGKLSYRSTRGCLVGYHSSTSYKYWDFERKCFDTSHDLIIKELEFPTAADFDEDQISVSQAPRARPIAASSPVPPTAPPPSVQAPQIFDQIVVEPPPSVQVFSTQTT